MSEFKASLEQPGLHRQTLSANKVRKVKGGVESCASLGAGGDTCVGSSKHMFKKKMGIGCSCTHEKYYFKQNTTNMLCMLPIPA